MAGKTSIGWTDGTANVWSRRCKPVAPECFNCYAWTITDRWEGPGAFLSGPPELLHGKLLNPWLDPQMRKQARLFLTSMGDPFYPSIPVEDHALVWAMMAASPAVTWQVLTKRPHIMHKTLTRDDLPERVHDAIGTLMDALPTPTGRLTPLRRAARDAMAAARDAFRWPLPNVHLGVSAGCQDTYDKFLPPLADTPAALKWVSVEPLIGPVALQDTASWLGWIVVGGESGRVHRADPWNPLDGRARPMDLEWARTVVREAEDAQVPVYMKQLGSVQVHELGIQGDFKGEDTDLWPAELEDLKVHALPAAPVRGRAWSQGALLAPQTVLEAS